MILVTCSGMNLGRAVWTRADMAGLVASHDLIRIAPDTSSVLPGYLFAFVSSRYGHAYIRKQIYGGNIKHVEPDHLAKLPVPRLGKTIEERCHQLVADAAELRSRATRTRRELTGKLAERMSWTPRRMAELQTTVGSRSLQRRLDAFHHATGVSAARECLAEHGSVLLGDVVEEVFEPGRGARYKVEEAQFGIPFLSSSAVFRLDPVGDYLVSKTRTPNLERLLVCGEDVLLPRSGQVGGIIGRAVLPLPTYYGAAASEHLVRVRCRTRQDAYFVWALLATEPGYYAALGTAFGSSIPSLDCALLSSLRVPWWGGQLRDDVVKMVDRIATSLTEAIASERAAIAAVEAAIEEAP